MNNDRCKLLITSADTPYGFYCARACLTSRKFNSVLCAVNNKDSELARTLEMEGAIIKQWDLSNVNSIRHCLQDIEALCLIVEPQFDCVSKIEKILEVARDEDELKRIVLWSSIIVTANDERREDHKNPIRIYQELEQLMKKNICDEWAICRIGVPMQFLFTLSQVMQNRNIIPLPIGESEFAPINIKDCGQATAYLLANFKNMFTDDFNKQTLTFTGSLILDGQQLVNKANNTLQTTLTFENVSKEEFRLFLEKQQELNNFEIEELMIVMELIRKDKLEFTNETIKEIINKQPMLIEQFFEENNAMFKPRDGRLAQCVLRDY